MGLILQIQADEKTKSFVLLDKTGNFSSDNPGGWGGQNPRIEDVTSSIVEIEGPIVALSPNVDPLTTALNTPTYYNAYISPNPDGSPIVPINPLISKLDLTGNFPNRLGLGYEVLPQQVGGMSNTKIISGKWTIKWTVSGTDIKGRPFTTSTNLVTVFSNDVTCCVNKQIKYVNKDAFKDDKQKAIIEMNAILESVCNAIECGFYDQADEMIQFLNQQCVCVNC